MVLKNVWAYTYIPLTILRHGVWGGMDIWELPPTRLNLKVKKEYSFKLTIRLKIILEIKII